MPFLDALQNAADAMLAALAIGYAFGAVPFGLLLTRMAGLGDVRAIGSGNIGATNVLRAGRKDIAALTLLLDGAKGAAAVLLALFVVAPALSPEVNALVSEGAPNPPAGADFSMDIAAAAGLGALLGHMFPLWLRFRGGKGVATGIGVYLGLSWPIGLAVCGSWLLIAAATRYSSLAALLGFVLAPVYFLVDGATSYGAMAIVFAALVWARHHANIRRLLSGAEHRIGAPR